MRDRNCRYLVLTPLLPSPSIPTCATSSACTHSAWPPAEASPSSPRQPRSTTTWPATARTLLNSSPRTTGSLTSKSSSSFHFPFSTPFSVTPSLPFHRSLSNLHPSPDSGTESTTPAPSSTTSPTMAQASNSRAAPSPAQTSPRTTPPSPP